MAAIKRDYNPTNYIMDNIGYPDDSTRISNMGIILPMLHNMLKKYGYNPTQNALYGIGANMCLEGCTMANMWQGGKGIVNNGLGYGLVQWTPATKYIDWCNIIGQPIDKLETQIMRICVETQSNIQWQDKGGESFAQFWESDGTPKEKCLTFEQHYEQAGVPNMEERYRYLNLLLNAYPTIGETETSPNVGMPNLPDNITPPKKEKESLYSLIEKTDYNVYGLSEKQIEYLKGKTVGETVRILQFTNRKNVVNLFGGKTELMQRYYKIDDVNKKGWLISNNKKINPKATDFI